MSRFVDHPARHKDFAVRFHDGALLQKKEPAYDALSLRLWRRVLVSHT
jgi:hypothetical protein